MKTPHIEILAVNGKALTEQLIIIEGSVEYTAENKVDIIQIKIQADKSWNFSTIFPPNCQFDVSYGWNEQVVGRRWILKEVHKNFNNNGKLIEITGQDPLRLLLDNNEAPAKLWTLLFQPGKMALSASQIVRVIGLANGFDVSDVEDSPDSPAQPYQQGTMSNGEFIYYVASKNIDYKVWADWDVNGVKRLHFKPRSTPSSKPSYKYMYGDVESIDRAILDFSSIEQFVKKDEVKQNSISSEDDACELSLRSGPVGELPPKGNVAQVNNVTQSDVAIYGTFKVADTTKAQVKKNLLNRGTDAKGIIISNNRKIDSTVEEDFNTRQVRVAAQLQKQQEQFGEAKMTTFGNPGVVAGILVEVGGLDNEVDGIWIVQEVQHQINSRSYTTDWVLKRNATNADNTTQSAAANNNQADEERLSLYSEEVQ